jgi:hypothetical protein
MHFRKEKAPEAQYATYTGAHAKRREVAMGRPGFEPGRAGARLAEFKVIPRPLHMTTDQILDAKKLCITIDVHPKAPTKQKSSRMHAITDLH